MDETSLVKKEIEVCQCASPEMTSAVGAGNLRKRTFRRFEFADSGTPAVGTDVPGCASVPRCAKVGRRVTGRALGVATCGFEPHGRCESIDTLPRLGDSRMACALSWHTGSPWHTAGVPRCASVPGSGLVGSRALRSSATIAIDAQSDSASIPVLTAGHRPAARLAGGRAAVWHTES